MLLGAMALTAVAIVLGICLGSTQISPASFFQALLSGIPPARLIALWYTAGCRGCWALCWQAVRWRCPAPFTGGAAKSSGQSQYHRRQHRRRTAGIALLRLFPSREGLLPFAAFLGALLTALLIFALAMGNGVSKVTLVLTGIAMSSILGAGMNCILILYPRRLTSAPAPFLVGGLSAVTLKGLRFAAVYILVGLALAMLLRRDMNIVSLGSNAARALGMNVTLIRFLLIVTAAILPAPPSALPDFLGFGA